MQTLHKYAIIKSVNLLKLCIFAVIVYKKVLGVPASSKNLRIVTDFSLSLFFLVQENIIKGLYFILIFSEKICLIQTSIIRFSRKFSKILQKYIKSNAIFLESV